MKPTQGEMMNPSEPQTGEPDYVDKSAQSADNTFYPNRGQQAPAYRYWEYR